MFGESDRTAPVRSFVRGRGGSAHARHIARMSDSASFSHNVVSMCTPQTHRAGDAAALGATDRMAVTQRQANVTRRYMGRSSAAFHTKRLVLDRSTPADGSAKTYLVYRQSCVWSSLTTRILGLQDHRPSRNHTCPSCGRLYLSIHPCISEHSTNN